MVNIFKNILLNRRKIELCQIIWQGFVFLHQSSTQYL
nr:MAG TPA: hypothetical protein [Caudoviricetes sp.]